MQWNLYTVELRTFEPRPTLATPQMNRHELTRHLIISCHGSGSNVCFSSQKLPFVAGSFRGQIMKCLFLTCASYEMNASAGFMPVLVALASNIWQRNWERIGNL